MESVVSLPRLQVPATCPCLVPYQSSPSPLSYFLKTNLNNVLSSTPVSSEWAPFLRFPHQNPVWISSFSYGNWVPVTTAWRVLRWRMEEQPPIWRVAANILNKQSRAAEKGWYSSLGFGRGANTSSL